VYESAFASVCLTNVWILNLQYLCSKQRAKAYFDACYTEKSMFVLIWGQGPWRNLRILSYPAHSGSRHMGSLCAVTLRWQGEGVRVPEKAFVKCEKLGGKARKTCCRNTEASMSISLGKRGHEGLQAPCSTQPTAAAATCLNRKNAHRTAKTCISLEVTGSKLMVHLHTLLTASAVGPLN
jgi:hypothetical protein